MVRSQIAALIDDEVDRLLAAHLFWEYCLYYDRPFFQNRPFLHDIADALQFVHDEYVAGRAVKVSISLPPRSGKSYITSLFCAWWLGKLPALSVMRNTCTATLYKKFSYDVRNIVRSSKNRAVFPEIQLAPDKQNVMGWNLTTSRQVGYFGSGVGGTIIGFGANLGITDDLYPDLDSALSPTYNDTVGRWKESTNDSRFERNCPEIYIGTRWSKNDEIGKAIEKGKVHRAIKIPALTEDGKSFCEDVKTTAEYLAIKADIDEVIFEAEYMQEPMENKGTLFPKSSLNFYTPDKHTNIEALREFGYSFIDPADTGGDDLSMPVCYLVGDKIYVVDWIYNKDGTDVNEPACVEVICDRKLNAVGIEGVSAWKLFGKSVRNKVQERYEDCEIRILKENRNKETRILENSAFIKNRFVFRSDYESLPQYKKAMQNLNIYQREGGNKHEDSPDSLCGAAKFFREHFPHLW